MNSMEKVAYDYCQAMFSFDLNEATRLYDILANHIGDDLETDVYVEAVAYTHAQYEE